jgi:hypothetical protein
LLGLLAAILGLITIFFVFADWLGFGATATSIGMFLVFLVLLIGSVVWTNSAKAHTAENAQRALSSRGSSPLLSPPLLTAGIRLGRTVGWRRAVPATLLTLVATGVAAEWSRRRRSDGEAR